MRRQRYVTIIFISILLFTLTVLCANASWFIQEKGEKVAKQYTSTAEDTSPYFVAEKTVYNGMSTEKTTDNALKLKLTPDGFALFDITLEDGADPYEVTAQHFTITWESGLYDDNADDAKKTAINTENLQHHIGTVAGYHYYKIVENATGQVICQKHKVKIEKASVILQSATASPTKQFVGKTTSYTITWKSSTAADTKTVTGSKSVDAFTAGTNFTSTFDVVKDFKLQLGNTDLFYINHDIENAPTATVSCTVLPTCYSVVSGSSPMFYGTLDQALEETAKTTAGTTLVAMAGFTYDGTDYTATGEATGHYDHKITGEKTITSNVTLKLPYTVTPENTYKATESTLDRLGTATATSVDPTCVNKVSLQGTLNNNGTIIIGGILGRAKPGGTQGATTGNYAMLRIESGKTLNTTGILDVFGYITDGGGATVNATSGVITMPFVVYDYHGGSHTVGAFKAGGIAPFTVFDMPNIQATLICSGDTDGVKINAYADLYTDTVAGIIDAQHNLTQFQIFGSAEDDALFKMANGTATFKYTPTQGSTFGLTGTSIPQPAASTTITLNGDTVSGDLSMTIKVAFITETVSLTQVKFPVSHKITLNLNGSNEYHFTSVYKFMPGSILNIGTNAEVIVEEGAGLMFYGPFTAHNTDGDNFDNATALKTYYKTETDVAAQCNVSGSLTVKGAIAGTIIPKSATAFLDVSPDTATFALSEQEGVGTVDKNNYIGMLTGSAFGFTKAFTENQTANGKMTDGTSATDATAITKGGYYGFSIGGTYAWKTAQSGIVQLNANGGTLTKGSTPAVFYLPNSHLLTAIGSLEEPTLADNRFVGWYMNADCTSGQEAENEKIIYASDNATNPPEIFAKWVYTPQITLVTKDLMDTSVTSTTETIFIDDQYRLLKQTAHCINPLKNKYLDSWKLTITGSDGTNITVEGLTPGEKICLEEILNLPTGWRDDPNRVNAVKGYSYTLIPKPEAKVTISGTLNISNASATVSAMINGKATVLFSERSSNTTFTFHARPTDSVAVSIAATGAYYWRGYYRAVKIEAGVDQNNLETLASIGTSGSLLSPPSVASAATPVNLDSHSVYIKVTGTT